MPEDWLSRFKRSARRRDERETVKITLPHRSHLKELREAAGLTQEDLAERLDLTRFNISYTERHESSCSVSKLIAHVEGCGGKLKLMAEFEGKKDIELPLKAWKDKGQERS